MIPVTLGIIFLRAPQDPDLAPIRADGRRGTASATLPRLDLQLAVEREGQAQRLGSDASVALGERALFRLASSAPTAASLWAEAPSGTEPIAQVQLGEQPLELRDGSGLLAWEFDHPGTTCFVASPEPMPTCRPPACVRVCLEAR